MKLPETVATEQELLKQRVRFLVLVNGYLSAAAWIAVAYGIYRLVGLFA